MEFEEFARQFRQRTTQRMREFERALGEAQDRVEKSAALSPSKRAVPPIAPRQSTQSRRGSARGQVQGLLRKS